MWLRLRRGWEWVGEQRRSQWLEGRKRGGGLGFVVVRLLQRALSSVGTWGTAMLSLTSTSSGGVFFIQESFVLQHVAALCEWVFIIDVLVFYGTFTFEFGAISTDTFLVLLRASRAPKSHKGEDSLPGTEGLPML